MSAKWLCFAISRRMRTPGSPAELERRRCLAVRRIREGHAVEEVAEILEVSPRSVRRWVAVADAWGCTALKARVRVGRRSWIIRKKKLSGVGCLAVLAHKVWARSCGRRNGWPR